MSEWRTIDSAPRDGRWILVWVKGAVIPGAAFYDTHHKEWIDSFWQAYFGPITHWMPLPEPPTDATP